MNKDEIEHFRQQLLCLRSKLEQEEEGVKGNKEIVELDQAKVFTNNGTRVGTRVGKLQPPTPGDDGQRPR